MCIGLSLLAHVLICFIHIIILLYFIYFTPSPSIHTHMGAWVPRMYSDDWFTMYTVHFGMIYLIFFALRIIE